MKSVTRRAILLIAACLLVVSLGVSAWIAREIRRCDAVRQVYRFGTGCVRTQPPVILERGIQRTQIQSNPPLDTG